MDLPTVLVREGERILELVRTANEEAQRCGRPPLKTFTLPGPKL